MAENLDFNCPQCRSGISVPPTLAGKRIPCPSCVAEILVPGIVEKQADPFADLFEDPDPGPAAGPDSSTDTALPPRSSEKAASAGGGPENGGESPAADVALGSMQTLNVDDFSPDDVGDDDDDSRQPLMGAGPGELGDDGATPTADATQAAHEPEAERLEVEDLGAAELPLSGNTKQVAGAGDELEPVDDELPLLAPLEGQPLNEPFDEPLDELLPIDDTEPESEEFVSFEEQVRRAEQANGQDPFEKDPNAPIALDDVPPEYGRESTSIVCPVCESRVYAHRSRAGLQVKCDDCFSMVDVPPFEDWKQPGGSAGKASGPAKPAAEPTLPSVPTAIPEATATAGQSDDTLEYQLEPLAADDEYGLEPLPEETFDTAGTVAASPPHPIENELFNRGETLADPADFGRGSSDSEESAGDDSEDDAEDGAANSDQTPGTGDNSFASSPTLVAADDDLGYELLPMDNDDVPLAGTASPAAADVSPMIQPVGPGSSMPVAEVGQAAEQRSVGAGQPQPIPNPIPMAVPTAAAVSASQAGTHVQPQAESPSQPADGDPPPQPASEPQDLFGEVKEFLQEAIQPLTSLDNWRYLGFFLLVMGLTYIAYAAFGAANAAENMAYVILGYATILPVMILISIAAFIFHGTIAYNIMLTATEREKDCQWPEFSFGEWFGQSLAVGPAIAVGMLPGLLVGTVAWLSIGYGLVLVPMFAGWSMLVLSGPLMMGSMYNESIYNAYAPQFFKTATVSGFSWMAYAALLIPPFRGDPIFCGLRLVLRFLDAVRRYWPWYRGDDTCQSYRHFVSTGVEERGRTKVAEAVRPLLKSNNCWPPLPRQPAATAQLDSTATRRAASVAEQNELG